MLGAFHIVKLAGDAPGEVRRRVQQDTTGHRGRTGDPLYQIRISCAPRVIGSRSVNKNDSTQPSRRMRRISVSKSPTTAPSTSKTSSTKPHPRTADAWSLVSLSAYQRVPSPKSLAWAGLGLCASGRTHSTPTSTQPEPATAPQKPSTDIIELGRRTAKGYPNPTNNKLRMLLIAGDLDAFTHTQL